MTVEEYLGLLTEVGWFDAYSTVTKARIEQSVRTKWAKDPSYAVFGLGQAMFYEDPDDVLDVEFPKRMIAFLASVSDGHFSPEGVTYEYFKKEVSGKQHPWCRVSFVFKGHEYATEYLCDYFEGSTSLFRLCHDALSAAGIPYRFYSLAAGDLGFVRPEAYASMDAKGWLRIRTLGPGKWGAIPE
jgi:hypothetical protein